MSRLVFLKLGGSLITDKTVPYTAKQVLLEDLARQLVSALQQDPDLALVLGHGSGSFGHTAAKEFGTRDGLLDTSHHGQAASETRYWQGFSEVWFQASALNRLVMTALHQAGLPALALAPVSAVTSREGKVLRWDPAPVKSALAARLVPVVYGDVVFDEVRGGTILSTEDLFDWLAHELKPERILLAGLEAAVWADYPDRNKPIAKITPGSFEEIKSRVGASQGADVTGGMESKVRQMLTLVTEIPGLSAQIFSGGEPGNLQKALAGEKLGTVIAAA